MLVLAHCFTVPSHPPLFEFELQMELCLHLSVVRAKGACSGGLQERFAEETLEIFAALANRLGISSWKEQLENPCLKHLDPDKHKEPSSRVLNSIDEAMITSAIEELERALRDTEFPYHLLSGRHKFKDVEVC
ncbi:hypothetical protein V6N13_144149 [Hibiscus sabdariffa]|uniref:Uncharacterized protein n=1 Tax=Hibiscus sabdariffa TaxID=183260 RepID=A0ABR2FJP0_9ROSI